MEAPTVSSYICAVTISTIPKFILILVASGVAAYRVELYSSLFVGGTTNLPTAICNFTENNNEYRGDRICNNAIGAAISTIIVAVVLMIIDLLIPCIETAFAVLAALFNILWATLLAAHWLVTGALLADLYRRYCNQESISCSADERRFTALTVMSFVCAAGWGLVVLHSTLRICLCKPKKGTYST